MRSNCVAVLDVRSSEICALVGERGVNGTFIIKSKYVCSYDGFAESELLDVADFNRAVSEVVSATLSTVGIKLKSFYVGIPGEFIKVVTTDKVLSFSAPKRISAENIHELIAISEPEGIKGYTAIKSSPIYYVLSDKRRIINPVGVVSDSIRGILSFYMCKSSFAECVVNAFKPFGEITDLNLLPQPYAEAMYLLSTEQRDGFAQLFDMGHISSTYSVVCGNGVLFSESFSIGTGHIAVLLMDELDIPYEVAEMFLSKVNLNAKERLSTIEECRYEGQVYSFSTSTLRGIIREGLDGICEAVETCRQAYTGKNLTGKPLLCTGEGIKTIRGIAEHISSRLVTAVEIVAPKLPYYDKPKFSSQFSLLAMALND